MRAILLATILLFSGGQAGQAQVAPATYRGACDGSAAVALNGDYFVVANDDDNILRVYRLGDAIPKASLDLDDTLQTERRKKDGSPKEADIEGAARVGNRIYWIASHGRDSKGDKESSRHRLFATDIVPANGASPPTLRAAGAYTNLVDDLLHQLKGLGLKEAAESAPESPDGLNIEGLAVTPDGELLVGLRNPRPNGMAIVIPLKNPADAVDRKATATFGTPVRIDLGTRGIRSIEWVSDRFLIVAGPFGDGGPGPAGDFALYSWPGPGGRAPRQDSTIDFASLKLRPEAIFAMPSTNEVYVLSDDGTKECKALPPDKRTFRGLAIGVAR